MYLQNGNVKCMSIHLFLAIKMGAAIYKFYGSSFRKQFILLLDTENVLRYYFNVLQAFYN